MKIFLLAFCPVHCGPEDMHCPGTWDHASGKQSSPDYCMPMKDPSTGCPNMCPVQCGENDQVCPGPKGEDGCQIMADTCFPAKENCPDHNLPECKDNWSTKKCEKRKNKGKCGKNKVAKNCQKTCGKC